MPVITKENVKTQSESIRPNHYKVGGMEPYQYMELKMSSEQLEGFYLGNVIKYTSRYPHKNGLEDLEKAQWYLTKLIELKSKGQ